MGNSHTIDQPPRLDFFLSYSRDQIDQHFQETLRHLERKEKLDLKNEQAQARDNFWWLVGIGSSVCLFVLLWKLRRPFLNISLPTKVAFLGYSGYLAYLFEMGYGKRIKRLELETEAILKENRTKSEDLLNVKTLPGLPVSYKDKYYVWDADYSPSVLKQKIPGCQDYTPAKRKEILETFRNAKMARDLLNLRKGSQLDFENFNVWHYYMNQRSRQEKINAYVKDKEKKVARFWETIVEESSTLKRYVIKKSGFTNRSRTEHWNLLNLAIDAPVQKLNEGVWEMHNVIYYDVQHRLGVTGQIPITQFFNLEPPATLPPVHLPSESIDWDTFTFPNYQFRPRIYEKVEGLSFAWFGKLSLIQI
eukprot:TRINITY_DN2525_c0_g1_i3.p1 TRINITY_DN2525_c0_g1~~TRINITY_DN2525_c0_g1_i3.p1  ORF type:complete len:362 (-),score=49.32 TRINITY_DN2525_c0_g1_i3:8-1093(-)